MGNNESSGNSNEGSNNNTYEGHGGARCTPGDIISGTNAMNSLTDDQGIGCQISSALTGHKANWACAAENIRDFRDDKENKSDGRGY